MQMVSRWECEIMKNMRISEHLKQIRVQIWKRNNVIKHSAIENKIGVYFWKINKKWEEVFWIANLLIMNSVASEGKIKLINSKENADEL